MVFTFNGNVHDFLVGFFFLFSSWLGQDFFGHAGLQIQKKDFHFHQNQETEIDENSLDNQNLALYFDRVMTRNEMDLVKEIKDKNIYKL